MTAIATTPPPPAGQMQTLKARLRTIWMAGDYDYFSRYMEQSAIEFLDRIKVPMGSLLLDVACGSGQLALVASRRGIPSMGVDIAANAIRAARGRAVHEGLEAWFQEGDAESLPCEDASFDVVASLFGAMFAPRPDLVASEMMRVARPGGMIAMANWTAEGFIGKMFKVIARFIAPPGMPSPVLWGDEETVRARFGTGVSDLRMTRVTYTFDYPFGPAEVVEFFRKYYGPMNQTFASLSDSGQMALREELTELWSGHNTSGSRRTTVSSEYLQIVAKRS
ncbi:MAG: class I SAM-dependent methyltransferase [Bryobacteraceae bacterium]|nr:class I SAM-dependent methyltransferase [Bryobacteraceae bacterium]